VRKIKRYSEPTLGEEVVKYTCRYFAHF